MFYLQEFLYAVCEHPTLRVSPAFHAFVSLKDDSHFEKYKKEFDKVSNPNAVIATSGITHGWARGGAGNEYGALWLGATDI